MIVKSVENLTPADFKQFPVWSYMNSDEIGELTVNPVKRLPLNMTEGKIIGVAAIFQNGNTYESFISNYSSSNQRMNSHFVTASFWIEGAWFHLSRYHDGDYDISGPNKLSELIKLKYEEIFPIQFDLTGIVKGKHAIFEYSEPSERLRRSEIIAMSLE